MKRRRFLHLAGAAGAGALLPWPAAPPGGGRWRAFNVRDYGAVGDGRANDTEAFQRVSRAVTADGGGTIVVPRGVYLVGRQRLAGAPGQNGSWLEEGIVSLADVPGPITIEGEGAVLRAAPGLRFGSFDPITGEPFQPPGGLFTDYDYRADAYWGMIAASGCRSLRICGLELDGNQDGLILGGPWGDAGYQCAATGLNLYGNGHVEIEDVLTHHHGQDGIMIGHTGAREGDAARPHVLSRVRSTYNARQGLSWVGGIGLTATQCAFSNTGKGRFASPPGAGVDVEAEGAVCRDGRFLRCVMEDNAGQAVIADTGDSADVAFEGCRFWGTTSHALWVRKPRYRFHDCDVYGTTVNLYGHEDPELATAFFDCRFEDRPDASGQVHRGAGVIEVDAHNVLFERCSVTGRGTRALWLDGEGTREILRDCVITHAFAELAGGDFQSLIRGTRLESVRFREDLPGPGGKRWYIATASVSALDVHVEGPRVRWGGQGGAIGDVGG